MVVQQGFGFNPELKYLSVWNLCIHAGFLYVLWFPPTAQKTCWSMDRLVYISQV